MFSEKIKELQKRNKFTQEELAELIGMTRTGFRGALANDEFKASTLLKLAKVFNVPITYFYEEDDNQIQNALAAGDQSVAVAGDGNFFLGGNSPKRNTTRGGEDNILSEKVKMLEKLLEEKERVIEEKERLIKILMEKR